MGCIQEADWPGIESVDDARLASEALVQGAHYLTRAGQRLVELERARLQREDYLEEVCIGVGP
jgi:hypothetical protein